MKELQAFRFVTLFYLPRFCQETKRSVSFFFTNNLLQIN